MIPIKNNTATETFPFVTILIILANVSVFVYQIFVGPAEGHVLIMRAGVIPYEITRGVDTPPPLGLPVQLTLLSSMFLHGGFLHIIGNMLYLWIFGSNVEDRIGHLRFAAFYLLCGIVASLVQVLGTPASTVPMVGASGAISGILGAYLILFPKARVLTLVTFFFFFRLVEIPAVIFLGMWIVLQFINVSHCGQTGVAWLAHIGGFFTGLILLLLFKKTS
jgi:membrane associated rhomboid family serine protease